MNTLKEFIAVVEFVGHTMTEEEATRILDEAKNCLTQDEIVTLQGVAMIAGAGELYTAASEHQGECGFIPGYSRY